MRICWAQYALWAVIALFGIGAMLAGCGAKGSLYLPEGQAQQQDQQQEE